MNVSKGNLKKYMSNNQFLLKKKLFYDRITLVKIKDNREKNKKDRYTKGV